MFGYKYICISRIYIQLQVFLLLNNQMNHPVQIRVTFNCVKIKCIDIFSHQIWKSMYMHFRHLSYDYDRFSLLNNPTDRPICKL